MKSKLLLHLSVFFFAIIIVNSILVNALDSQENTKEGISGEIGPEKNRTVQPIAPLEGIKEIVGTGGATELDCKEYLAECEAGNNILCIKWGTNCREKEEATVGTKDEIKFKDEKIYFNDKEIKIMPETASEIAIQKLNLKKEIQIELKDTGKSVYEIDGKKDVKLLGLVEIEMPVKVQVNIENGDVENVDKPWWSFLVGEKEALDEIGGATGRDCQEYLDGCNSGNEVLCIKWKTNCQEKNETVQNPPDKYCKEVGVGCDYAEVCNGNSVVTIDNPNCCVGECTPANQITSCEEINKIRCLETQYCSQTPISISNGQECCSGKCLLFPYSINPINMQCNQVVKEGLCISEYKNRFFIKEFENSNIKIWFEYPRNVKLNESFEFSVYLKNQKSTQQQINLEFHQSNDFELIRGNIPSSQNLLLSANEEKQILNVSFKALKKRIDGMPLSIWSEGLSNSYESVGSIVTVYSEDDFILCDNVKYPASILEGPCQRGMYGTYCYPKGICSSNVFYPVDCTTDKDCIVYGSQSEGILRFGRCSYGICAYQNVTRNGIGEKNILIIDYSSESTSSNICNITDSVIADDLKEYYSFKSDQYNIPLTIKNVKKLANININQLGIDSPEEILNKTKDYFYQQCGNSFNFNDFNIFVLQYLTPEDVIYNQLVDEGWMWMNGCVANNPMTCKGDAGESTRGQVLAHEMHHYFGCGDLYNLAGGDFQYANNIMGSAKDYSELNFEDILINVCDAQMGWIDLDDDGVPEILE